MTTLFQSITAATFLLAAGGAHAMQVSPYDDTTYADVEVTWFSGTTAGGPGLEHDDAIYPEKMEISGDATPAFSPAIRFDDVTYPDSPILAQVGVPSSQAEAGALASPTPGNTAGDEGSGSR
jgi:hypothetical protein